MLNIFYNPSYFKTKKVFLTRQFKHSIFINLLFDINYLLNTPTPEKFIFSGPQKRMNNLIKTFKFDSQVSFNSLKYDNTYIVQFDNFGKEVLQKILNSENRNKKIIIGPLYDSESGKELNKLTNEYSFIKKLVSSNITFSNQLAKDSNFVEENTLICPSGVASRNEVNRNLKIKNRNKKCLVYFKKRSTEELKKLTNFLNSKNLDFEIFEYTKYTNDKLKLAAKEFSFGITLSSTESQGFAIQEIMSCNLPLIVWDKTINNYGGLSLPGTTVTVWDHRCGVVVENYEELTLQFDNFYKNLNTFNPAELVLEKLTFEMFNQKLKECFKF